MTLCEHCNQEVREGTTHTPDSAREAKYKIVGCIIWRGKTISGLTTRPKPTVTEKKTE